MGSILSHASVRTQEAKGKEDNTLTNSKGKVVKEAEVADLPMAKIDLTVSGKTQSASSARNSILPVAVIQCLAIRSTTAVADFVAVSSATRRHMRNLPTMTNTKNIIGQKLVAI